ncbi:MAG: hypothetical protein GY861_12890 [bacterium]|nr:hypothetical protein [bacterium]
MIYERKNLCRSKINNYEVSSGDEFVQCNLSRSVPHTEIFKGLTELKFIDCNLLNCDVPKGSVIVGGLHIHKSICSHLHKNRLDAGEITECEENCEHVIDSDEVFPDFIVYKYEDKVVI